MAESTLAATAQRMVAPGKGIFAADVPLKGLVRGWWGESVHASTEDAACDFQEMICRTPGLGEHGIERQFEVTERFLHRTFETLYEHGVSPEEIVLKTNMVVSGSDCPEQAGVNTVARETLRCLRRVVPPALPGIGFLSGGQSDRDATAHLDAMNRLDPQPWALSFSFGRAIGRAPVEAWDGKTDESSGQTALRHRARMNGLATLGEWSVNLEDGTEDGTRGSEDPRSQNGDGNDD